MEVNPSAVASQLHRQQWLADIRECNARPKGMTVDEWCQLHGIKKNTYYWRMKKLRRECLEEIQASPDEQQTQPLPAAASFVELPQVFLPANADCVTLNVGASSMEIPESISDDFLRRILEAARHA